MNDDDDRWFDSLAGNAGEEPRKTVAAARSIRAAILEYRAAEELPVAGENPERENELIARARAEGLLKPRPIVQRPRWPAFLAAAAIAGLAVGVTLHLRTETPGLVTRGASSEIVTIRASDPMRLQQELLRELRAAGLEPKGYESFGRKGLDADLPAPVPPGVRDILARHGIAVPTGHVLQLEIEVGAP
jgi:hypothetical protein